jgi:hypothetical protein
MKIIFAAQALLSILTIGNAGFPHTICIASHARRHVVAERVARAVISRHQHFLKRALFF